MLEAEKPREDYLLKLDILQDEVQKQVDNFLAVERQARAKFTAADDHRSLLIRGALADFVNDAMLNLHLAMGRVREAYAEHGSFTPGVGARDEGVAPS